MFFLYIVIILLNVFSLSPFLFLFLRFLKTHPIFRILNSYLVDSPQPANLSYLWNFGSLLGLCLIIQIISGILLSINYNCNIDLAFSSVEHFLWCALKTLQIAGSIKNLKSTTCVFVKILLNRKISLKP